jgi:hypothetical protein
MNIPILPSKMMDKCISEGNVYERRLMRMPKDFRDFAEYIIGDFVYAKSKDGQIISLAVDQAYEEDVKTNSLSAFVATEIYNLLVGNSGGGFDVELVDGITFGCDPELIIVNQEGTVIPASGFFKKWGQVGYDGLLMELRPLPSTDENAVAFNLLNLLKQARQEIPNKNLRMIAVSSYHADAQITIKYKQPTKLTAGFHLHYGLPKELLGYPKRFIAMQLVKIMDYYVGIPAILPEGHFDSYRRSVPYIEYGKPGTYRIDNRTLEYRVPGGILMRHPTWTAGIIGLGAVVIEDLVSRIKYSSQNFSDLSEMSRDEVIRGLYPNIPPAMEVFRSICAPNIEVARIHLKNIKSDVEKMVGYARRQESIKRFFNNLEKSFSPDVEENWWRYYGQGQSRQMDFQQASF